MARAGQTWWKPGKEIIAFIQNIMTDQIFHRNLSKHKNLIGKKEHLAP